MKEAKLAQRYAYIQKYRRFCKVNGYPKVLGKCTMQELWEVLDSILDFEEESKDFLEFNAKYPNIAINAVNGDI